MFHSIKIRLTLFYTMLVFLLFLVSAALLYFGLQELLIRQLDHELHLYADVIEDSYNPAGNNFKSLEEGTELLKSIRRDWVRILRTDSSVVFNSDRFAGESIPFPFARAETLDFDDFFFRDFTRSNGRLYRSIILPVRNEKLKTYFGWVEVAQSTHNLYHPIHVMRKLMFLATPFILLFIGLISYFMVQRSFRPLAAMAKKIDEISSSNLDQRLPIENPQDEIGQIAVRFNKLLSRLETSFNKQSQLLTDVAHELKTPMAALRGHWEQQIENEELPEPMRLTLAADIEEIARLSKMVNDLLLLSQNDNRVPAFQFEKLDLSAFLESLMEDMQVLVTHKKQHLKFSTDGELHVLGDVHFLRRMFSNLLDNAIKYTPEKGTIAIKVRNSYGMVEVIIRDTGIGIPPEDIPFVFDRFYRSDKARSRDLGGNGLGLAICKWIVEAHDGTITVDSNLEKGTIVKLLIPCLQDI